MEEKQGTEKEKDRNRKKKRSKRDLEEERGREQAYLTHFLN